MLLSGVAASAGCGAEGQLENVAVHGRADLALFTGDVDVAHGRSTPVDLPVGSSAASVMIEVRGAADGFYFLDAFVTPDGQDLVAEGEFITREAREVEGLADFLFPNDAANVLASGTYSFALRAFADREATQPLANDRLELRMYVKDAPRTAPCGVHLDFLVDNTAIDIATFEAAVDAIVDRVDTTLQTVGIRVVDFQLQRVDLRSPDIDLRDRSVLSVADNVLDQARAQGSARQNSVHVLLVRSIAGEDVSGFNPAGYSMGLPGPYDADRPNATVLVASELYAAEDEGGKLVLDAEGLATSLTHEVGHFLGLYHTTERSGDAHDPLEDTPECATTGACRASFLRNVMTSASWLNAAGLDPAMRSEFTPEQGLVMRGHPLCVPSNDGGAAVPPPRTCSLDCEPPTTCASEAEEERCAVACDPMSTTVFCDEGVCKADDRGTFVCG